jgi:hypothetical protein
MAKKSLSHLSDIATQETNTTGVTTPILTVDPTDGTRLRFLQMVLGGVGLPVHMDLRDSADNALPDDTELIFRVDLPTSDEPIAVSVRQDNIAAWNKLIVSEQQNEENRDAVRVELKDDIVNVRYKDTFRIEVNSSAQIDWSNSEL